MIFFQRRENGNVGGIGCDWKKDERVNGLVFARNVLFAGFDEGGRFGLSLWLLHSWECASGCGWSRECVDVDFFNVFVFINFFFLLSSSTTY